MTTDAVEISHAYPHPQCKAAGLGLPSGIAFKNHTATIYKIFLLAYTLVAPVLLLMRQFYIEFLHACSQQRFTCYSIVEMDSISKQVPVLIYVQMLEIKLSVENMKHKTEASKICGPTRAFTPSCPLRRIGVAHILIMKNSTRIIRRE